jgi:outer membrane protein assembly factor BamB
MNKVTLVVLITLAAVCLGGCAVLSPSAAAPTAAPTATQRPPATATLTHPAVATRDTHATPIPFPTFSAPTLSPSERQATSQTWLYLTAFQSHNVSVVDPHSGHVLHEFAVVGDQAGMAVAPDGSRLYIVDGQGDGELRIYDTKNWQVIYRETVAARQLLLGGNPIALSGDGRWLVLAHYNYQTRQRWSTVFDTRRFTSLPGDALPLRACPENYLPVGLIGRLGHTRLYAHCNGTITALDSNTLQKLWEVNAPTAVKPALQLAPDGTRLYGLYPRVGDLRLQVWRTSDGQLLQEVLLSDRISVPLSTFGRGEGGYLETSPDGARLYLAWEDRLWALASDSLQVVGEVQVPTPTDGLALSVDGGELYLLPATAGDLKTRERGMWTVDAATLKIVRHASDWPAYVEPFFFAVPAPKP